MNNEFGNFWRAKITSTSTINTGKYLHRTTELSRRLLAVAATLTFLSSSVGAMQIIDFESDPPGPLDPNTTYIPTGSVGLGFNYISAELGDYGIASEGNAFRSTAFGTSGVISIGNSGFSLITLPNPDNVGNFTSISFDFGNDDPALTNPGDLAFMRILLAGDLIDEVSMPLNRDSALNQSITFEGAEFARVEFAFTDAFGAPILGLDEVVDNVTNTFVTPPPVGIPEPSTLALFGLGLAVLGFTRRKIKA